MSTGQGTSGGWLSRFLSDDRRARLVVVLGVAAMALILLSGLWDFETPKSAPQDAAAQQTSAELERRLEAILSSVEGVGRAQVMVTLVGDAETVYAQNEKQTAETATGYAQGEPVKVDERRDSDRSFVIVDGAGGKQALTLTRREPAIRGVVVVCQGAGSAVVRERVMNAVMTVLGVTSLQVCVVPSA